MRVHSELDKGTTFEIILPRVEEAELVIGKDGSEADPQGSRNSLDH